MQDGQWTERQHCILRIAVQCSTKNCSAALSGWGGMSRSQRGRQCCVFSPRKPHRVPYFARMRGNYSSLQCSASTYQGCQMGNFQTKNPIWLNLDGLAMEDVGIFNLPFGLFCGNSVYFVAIWYTYVRYGYLVIFSPFWYFVPRKIWQPWHLCGCRRRGHHVRVWCCIAVSMNGLSWSLAEPEFWGRLKISVSWWWKLN
jgi:hypothetical protein